MLPRRRAWLRIFVVRCSLPCDPPVGGHSCNGGMPCPLFRQSAPYKTWDIPRVALIFLRIPPYCSVARQTRFGVQNAVDTLSENCMGKNLTEAAVKRARAPKTGQTFLWDAAVKGFGLRILPSGSKTFWFQYRPRGGGSSRMIRIGPFPANSVAKARDVAREYAAVRARGGNPAADLKAERMRDKATLRVLLAEDGPYQLELQRRGVVNIKPALSSLRRGLHGLMSKEVTHLTQRDLVHAIDAIRDDGRPGAAQDLRRFRR